MARKLRLQYEGAVYHVMNRGDRREPIFQDDRDRETFLETLGQCCARTGWQVHALRLMPNYFHLVVETPDANLVARTDIVPADFCLCASLSPHWHRTAWTQQRFWRF